MMSLKRVVLGTLIVSAAFFLIGCPDGSLLDLFGGAAGPTPGDSGAIYLDAIDQTTIDISWTAATHDTTPTADIEYQVYYAASDSIGTPEDAIANGNQVFAAWEVGRDSATLSGLIRDTEYWVTVVARVSDANMTTYTARTVSTAMGPVIRLEDEATLETILEGTTIDYGDVYASSTVWFNICNDGDQDLTLSSLEDERVILAGDVGTSSFYVMTQPPLVVAIAPNNKETFIIVFQTDGSSINKYATATIASNDPSNAEFIFQLTAFAAS